MPSRTIERVGKASALIPGLLRPARPGLVVLLYHGVGAGGRGIDLTVDAFRRQLVHLRERAHVVALAEGLALAADSRLDRDLVVLSFDDGTEDFHSHALPLLAEFRFPAILYLSTGPVEERIPFPSWGEPDADARPLNWSQVREAVATGLVQVGSHTHSHADLDRVAPAQMDEELRRSRLLIEERLGAACPDFAYPHAVTSRAAEAAVRRHYDSAAVGGWKKNRAGAIDRYRIHRVPITRADGNLFFRAKVRGRMAAEALLYRLGGTKRAPHARVVLAKR